MVLPFAGHTRDRCHGSDFAEFVPPGDGGPSACDGLLKVLVSLLQEGQGRQVRPKFDSMAPRW